MNLADGDRFQMSPYLCDAWGNAIVIETNRMSICYISTGADLINKDDDILLAITTVTGKTSCSISYTYDSWHYSSARYFDSNTNGLDVATTKLFRDSSTTNHLYEPRRK